MSYYSYMFIVTAFTDLSCGCMLNSQKASHFGTVEHAHIMNTGRGLQLLVTCHIFGAIVEINIEFVSFVGLLFLLSRWLSEA